MSVRKNIFTEFYSCCQTDIQYKLFAPAGDTNEAMEKVGNFKDIKRLAVMKVNTVVHNKEFHAMSQLPRL